ncbi:MAG: site-specific integrase [Alphaproteobacteria bacterium]|nr:site-specific integrase [Alphaproteobacteria bacterium]
MFDGRLQVYRRPGGRVWQCAARVGGVRFRESTHEENLDRAKDIAEEWYLDLRGKTRRGEIVAKKKEPSFGDAWALYLKDVRVLAIGVRTPKYVQVMEQRVTRNVLPFFKDIPISEVNRGLVQAYRVKRGEESLAARGKPPARSTMLQEIVHIRQVLKHAEGLGWIPYVPNLQTPYLTQGKKGRRAWFSPEEYKKLREATRRRITEGKRPGWQSHYEDLHNFVVFMANTGLRPDEALTLEFRDVSVENDPATKKTILVIDVRGKTGVGYCKSMPNAVFPFEEVRRRRIAELNAARDPGAPEVTAPPSTDRVFPRFDRHTFNAILDEEGLRFDRDGQRRTAYSLRHTYISMRLMEGANIHQIANNCRTSVQMIEEHYAAHIKDRLDTAAINVQRPRAVRQASRKTDKARSKADSKQDDSTLDP